MGRRLSCPDLYTRPPVRAANGEWHVHDDHANSATEPVDVMLRRYRGKKHSPASFYLFGALGMALPVLIFVIGSLVLDAVTPAGQRPDDAWIGMLFLFASVPLLLNVVLFYRMWNQIQDGSPRMSAPMAVALMFIPLLNVYGQFHAYYGLAKDLNEYTTEKAIPAPRTPAWAALIVCILMCVLFVPLAIGLVVGFFTLFGGIALMGLGYLLTLVLGPFLGIFAQIAWWCMIAQSAAIARAKRAMP